MPSRRVSIESYNASFSGDSVPESSRRAKALSVALEVRKFEIDLYWKRAAYFWVFTGAALAGHVAALTAEVRRFTPEALLLTSCVGLVFAFAWYLVNRGSKFWQSNWEAHVDLLEDAVHGPLYKTVLTDNTPWWELNGAYKYSVSKINQLLSLFVAFIFLLLLANTGRNYYVLTCDWQLFPTACILFTSAALYVLVRYGIGSNDERDVSGNLRETRLPSDGAHDG